MSKTVSELTVQEREGRIMRINSTHKMEARGLDQYFTPPEATQALISLERLPRLIWEPCCGDGAIVKPLRRAGHEVFASDIAHYGLRGTKVKDYLQFQRPRRFGGIVTNPPFNLAMQIIEKALHDAPYVAVLLRLNFLESTRRMPFFQAHPPSRIWVSSRRLPMMSRYGWTGPTAPSNICFAWYIFDGGGKCEIKWFDWKEWND